MARDYGNLAPLIPEERRSSRVFRGELIDRMLVSHGLVQRVEHVDTSPRHARHLDRGAGPFARRGAPDDQDRGRPGCARTSGACTPARQRRLADASRGARPTSWRRSDRRTDADLASAPGPTYDGRVSTPGERLSDRLRAVWAALDLSAVPKREGWLLTAAAILLGAATLPVPGGPVRWVMIGLILVGWYVAMHVLARRAEDR
jgi:hypothetical protein